jgi:hypothetical protein
MKNRIISRLGAIQTLLATFGSKANATAFGRLLLLGLAVLVATPSQAAKPGGATPTGTIYYIGPWPDATHGGTAVMTTMNPDGSNKTALGLGLFGVPSEALHGGHRWFVYVGVVTDQYYPNGSKRMEIVALRDDYQYAENNNSSTKVKLTDDITLEGWAPDWIPGDAQISFIGRRWSSAEPDATIVEGGIYTASLAFDAEGNITGLAAQPLAPAIPLPLLESPAGGGQPGLAPDVLFYSWAPTGDMVAYSNRADSELLVADLLGGRTRIFAGNAHMPKWSPLGDKIAFTRGGIWTIKINGTGAKEVVRSTSTWYFNHAHWSPDGKYLVFGGQNRLENNQDLFRATATGGDLVQLTSSPAPFLEQMFEGQGGWR